MAETQYLTLDGDDELLRVLKKKSSTDYNKFIRDQTALLYNEAKRNAPVYKGPLRNSAKSGDGYVGFTEEYAPHVELGHRLKNGGYVRGQHYLKRALDRRKPAFTQGLREELAKK